MALHPRPEGYAEEKEELLKYCGENNITFPFQDYPFAWPEVRPLSRSISPDFGKIGPIEFDPTLEEPPHCTEELQVYLNTTLTVRENNDLVNTRKAERFDLELLTYRQKGPDTLRKYGPNSLKKCATLLPKYVLHGEDGMEISKDTRDVDVAFEKDSRLTVTEDDASFLKEIISRCNNHESVEFIHSKPEMKEIILSPPLLPYSPSLRDISPPPLPEVEEFDNDPLSSQSIWDRFPSLSPQYIESIAQNIDTNPSPNKVITKETTFISNLRMELPLTPASTKKPTVANYERESLQNFRNLKSSIIPPSPESPSNDPLQHLIWLENELFQETISAESSLRLPLPTLPPNSPKQNMFPISMLGIYIAEDGLHCNEIPRSVIDSLNDEMKWLPFAKTSRNIDAWCEEVEGDWEAFVDYTGTNIDGGTLIHQRNVRIEDEEVLEIYEMDAHERNVQNRLEFSDILDIVRKRKSISHDGRDLDVRGTDGGWKRLKWSQQSRMKEFMSSRGQHLDLNDKEISAKFMILGNDNTNSQTVNATIKVPQLTASLVAPSLPFDPSNAVPAIILSTITLRYHFLTEFLRRTLSHTAFFERDVVENDHNDHEGDIILSPNRCIVFFTLAQTTQTIPSHTSNRILAVASKYRQLELIVTCSGSVSGKDIAFFSGWLEKVRSDYNIRLVFTNGQEELMRWIGWMCLWKEGDADINAEYLSDEETEEELFLRRIFNVYNSQIILAHMTLQQFTAMSHEMRMEKFHHLVSQRNLLRFDASMRPPTGDLPQIY